MMKPLTFTAILLLRLAAGAKTKHKYKEDDWVKFPLPFGEPAARVLELDLETESEPYQFQVEDHVYHVEMKLYGVVKSIRRDIPVRDGNFDVMKVRFPKTRKIDSILSRDLRKMVWGKVKLEEEPAQDGDKHLLHIEYTKENGNICLSKVPKHTVKHELFPAFPSDHRALVKKVKSYCLKDVSGELTNDVFVKFWKGKDDCKKQEFVNYIKDSSMVQYDDKHQYHKSIKTYYQKGKQEKVDLCMLWVLDEIKGWEKNKADFEGEIKLEEKKITKRINDCGTEIKREIQHLDTISKHRTRVTKEYVEEVKNQVDEVKRQVGEAKTQIENAIEEAGELAGYAKTEADAAEQFAEDAKKHAAAAKKCLDDAKTKIDQETNQCVRAAKVKIAQDTEEAKSQMSEEAKKQIRLVAGEIEKAKEEVGKAVTERKKVDEVEKRVVLKAKDVAQTLLKITHTIQEHKQTLARTIDQKVNKLMDSTMTNAMKNVMERLEKENKFDNERQFKKRVEFLEKAVYTLIGVVSFLLFILIVALIYMCTQSGQPAPEMHRRQLRRRPPHHRPGQRKHIRNENARRENEEDRERAPRPKPKKANRPQPQPRPAQRGKHPAGRGRSGKK